MPRVVKSNERSFCCEPTNWYAMLRREIQTDIQTDRQVCVEYTAIFETPESSMKIQLKCVCVAHALMVWANTRGLGLVMYKQRV